VDAIDDGSGSLRSVNHLPFVRPLPNFSDPVQNVLSAALMPE